MSHCHAFRRETDRALYVVVSSAMNFCSSSQTLNNCRRRAVEAEWKPLLLRYDRRRYYRSLPPCSSTRSFLPFSHFATQRGCVESYLCFTFLRAPYRVADYYVNGPYLLCSWGEAKAFCGFGRAERVEGNCVCHTNNCTSSDFGVVHEWMNMYLGRLYIWCLLACCWSMCILNQVGIESQEDIKVWTPPLLLLLVVFHVFSWPNQR